MRNLINITEDIGLPSEKELEAFKSVIASKIKQLPDDDATAKTLKEIEELLQHVQAGGRMGMINGELHAINDPAVSAAQKSLARYIASMEVSPKDRSELFSLWKAGTLVNIDKLLSKKSHSFSEIFNKYDTNQAIKELVDDVMQESALGQGKGEFGLNVLSKSIAKPGKHYEPDADSDNKELKGDLLIKFNNKWRKIEVKTTHGGGARFSDQEVRPAEGYERAAADLTRYVSSHRSVTAKLFPNGIPSYGINLNKAIEFYQSVPPKNQAEFLQLVANVITLIFGGKSADKVAVKKIVSAIKSGNNNEAIQSYAQASFNFYMSKKDDEGVLAINLNEKNFMFYSSAEDLANEKLRLNADTIYLTAKDVQRGAYPQLSVVPTTFGANARAKAAHYKNIPAIPDKQPGKRTPSREEVYKQFEQFATLWAQVNGIPTNKQTISALYQVIANGRSLGWSNKKIDNEMKKFLPALQQPTPQPTPRARRSDAVSAPRRRRQI